MTLPAYDNRWRFPSDGNGQPSKYFSPAADMLWWLEFWKSRNNIYWNGYEP